ncbi:uncharacterized protein LOC113352636 [Papaver somniferum]|uniref:uncharacterized protein LOC113352636 n=1 Tax=Papaver somniferum TaxID=3469 RepID=UPI000E6F54FE|nr:uncharacterized protein LOC113352636 [Papaver somniferum]
MKKLIKRHKPTIVALLETRVLASHAVRIVRQLGSFESVLVDAEGFYGGMCLMWNPDEVDIQNTKESRWAVHVVVTAKLQSPWILSTIYGSTNKANRKRVWSELQAVSDIPNSEWTVMGNLNTIGGTQEKRGGRNTSTIQLTELRDVMDNCRLIDLGFSGPKFTWNNKRVGAANIKERLDRAVSNSSWINRFNKVQVLDASLGVKEEILLLVIVNIFSRTQIILQKFGPLEISCAWLWSWASLIWRWKAIQNMQFNSAERLPNPSGTLRDSSVKSSLSRDVSIV